MSKIKFQFTREQQKGIIGFFLIVIVVQFVCLFAGFKSVEKEDLEKQKWLSLNSKLDSLEKKQQVVKIYPFNPNFISDYKGYQLGMSVVEIDRLLAFRKQNKYVNSVEEFQKVTGVSDSLLAVIAPYFKFPDWVKNKKSNHLVFNTYLNRGTFSNKEKIVVKDINQASQEDLMKIYGIGEALSIRILKFKERLGGFVSMDQMKDVWGLNPEVINRLKENFKIEGEPEIKKLDINNASIKELAQFSYFNYNLAREIVIYRSMNGDIKNADDLKKIKGMPIENATIIALYLDF